MMRGNDVRGFTLMDVIIALAIGGVVVFGARVMLTQIGDAARQIGAAAHLADRDANAERLLRSLVSRLEVGTSESTTFSGAETVATFTTWCDVPAGWLERCEAAIEVQLAADTARLVLSFGGQNVVLRHGFETAELRYLNTAAQGGQWFRQWGTGITAPLAMGIIIDGDTTIVRIGERG